MGGTSSGRAGGRRRRAAAAAAAAALLGTMTTRALHASASAAAASRPGARVMQRRGASSAFASSSAFTSTAASRSLSGGGDALRQQRRGGASSVFGVVAGDSSPFRCRAGVGVGSAGGSSGRAFGSAASPPAGSLRASSATGASDDEGKEPQNTNEPSKGESKSEDKKKKNAKTKKKKKREKFRINPRWREEADLDALTAEFDEMAKREGFDLGSSAVFYADGDTFEDDFGSSEEMEGIPDAAAMEAAMEAAAKAPASVAGSASDDDFDFDLDPDDFNLEDFDVDGNGDDDDGYLDFGTEFGEATALGDGGDGRAGARATDEDEAAAAAERDRSMADRIAAAGRDADLGRVTVGEELGTFAKDVTEADLRALGYRREANPFGDDETPRKEDFVLVTNAMVCSACGADFQCQDEGKPGYLPPDKYETQVKLGKIEDVQRLQEKAESAEWSPEDEIEWLIRSEGGESDGAEGGGGSSAAPGGIDVQAMAAEMGLDLVELSTKKVICKRCHGLQNFGAVDEKLRPGWSEEPLLSQEAFRDLLKPIGDRPAVIIALVDLFDFSGSVLPELDAIARDNPVILAANKADLLPSKMGQARAENWVRRELEYLGVKSIANVGGAVRLVSCKTGFGLTGMLGKARALADEMECNIYLVGSANAGKSTLVNHILAKNEEKTAAFKFGKKKKKRAGNATARKGAVTVSPLPGTTLKFIEVNLGNDQKLYDTPGLLVPGTLTQRLTPAELKMVVPKKQVEPVTFRVASGKCVLVGGLARVEVVGDSKPFLFTFFVSNDVKLHPTNVERADDFIAKHAGGVLTPPLEPGPERMQQIGEFESHTIDIEGAGWKDAAADITLRGLGWVAVTGAGTAKVKVSVPKGVGVSVRPPLMPFDIWEATARYTGGRTVRKGGKTRSGKQRKGVGRR